MFTAEQYRAKAAEFRTLLNDTSCSPNETSEFRDLEQTYTTLAENEEWMAVNIDRTFRRRKYRDNRTGLTDEEEKILSVLGGGRDHAVEYYPYKTPTGAVRLREHHRSFAADNAAERPDRPLSSRSQG